MSTKDEKNLAQVTEKIAKMDEPRQSVMRRVHDVIMTAAQVHDAAIASTRDLYAAVVDSVADLPD